ncbi:MAG: Unknown protein [uncultured Sulfurovum sp.]|uniref:Uncharacterized protein n=1 Tax=uncultured Sulfurovum sp. TaxID=269237 RepID=A0A6S6SFY0_9BACT|nr:MAG: Unknown protein [uncultured Sulfurovum sp.]
MKKLMMTFVAVVALSINAQAEFSFRDMFVDMKEAATSMAEDTKDSIVNVSENIKEATSTETKENEKKEVIAVSSEKTLEPTIKH